MLYFLVLGVKKRLPRFRLIPKIIRLEMARQLHMYRLCNQLRAEANLPLLPPDRRQDSRPIENRVALSVSNRLPLIIQDLTEIFTNTNSQMIQKSISSESVVLGLKLEGFAGKIGSKEMDSEGSQLPRLVRISQFC